MQNIVVIPNSGFDLKCYNFEPEVAVYKDCIYVPANRGNFWEDRFWGVYDSSGRIIDAAAFRNSPGMQLVGQNETCLIELADVPYAPRELYFYVGNIMNHYGHFICSSMARLWALPQHGSTSVPLVGHAMGGPIDWFNWPFVAPLFGSAGIMREDFAEFQTPVRFRALVVAQPSFVEQNLAYKVYAQAAHAWGDRLVKTQDLSSEIDAVYLSRSRLGWKRDDVSNEAELVAALERAGVVIVYPEQLTIPEQIALFRRAKRIFGQSGSAFHTAIFAEPTPSQLLVSIVTSPNSYSANHALMELANDNRSLHVYLDGAWSVREGGGRGFDISDPESAATQLLELTSDDLIVDARIRIRTGEPDWPGLTDAALGKTAHQSSLSLLWSEPGEASNACCGSFPSDFSFCTEIEHSPFWQLDLDQIYPLEMIVVHNRLIYCQDRARHIVLEISDDGRNWTVIHRGHSVFGAKGNALILNLSGNLSGRFIKISLDDYQYLHLSKVEVLVDAHLIGK